MAEIGEIKVPVKVEWEPLSLWNWKYEALRFLELFFAALIAIWLHEVLG